MDTQGELPLPGELTYNSMNDFEDFTELQEGR